MPETHASHQASQSDLGQTDPGALYEPDGPISPTFMREAVRTLMRALPINDPKEPAYAATRRMFTALTALSTLRPRDEIELMLGVQAIASYHAAAALWRLGMNLLLPKGDSTRHFTTAATAARTFDTMLRAIERRQARALPATERPAPRQWAPAHPAAFVNLWASNCQIDEDAAADPAPDIVWTPEAIALANERAEQDRLAEENAGLDLANTPGILPGGGMIVPEVATPQQEAYLARRNALRIKREWAENQRNGLNTMPEIRPIRTGDLIP
jgi:hypothetical protein